MSLPRVAIVAPVALMSAALLSVASHQAVAQPHGYAQPPVYIQPAGPCANGQCGGGSGCCEGQCSPDGICYPKRSTWGYHVQKWNRWPGDYDDALPTSGAKRADGDLPDVNVPIPAPEEDLQAPPPTEQEKPADDQEGGGNASGDEGSGASEITLPPLPPLGTPPASPLGNPPPAFPGFPTQPPAETGPAPEGEFSQYPGIRRLAPVVEDAPPGLPRGFMKVLKRGSTQTAVYTPETPRPGQPSGVQPASAHRLPGVR